MGLLCSGELTSIIYIPMNSMIMGHYYTLMSIIAINYYLIII